MDLPRTAKTATAVQLAGVLSLLPREIVETLVLTSLKLLDLSATTSLSTEASIGKATIEGELGHFLFGSARDGLLARFSRWQPVDGSVDQVV